MIRTIRLNEREIAERLILTRKALGYENQAEFARYAEIGERAYNNYERWSRIGLDAAVRLCARYDLSLDWIYFGIKASLPGGVSNKIEAFEKGQHSTEQRRHRR